MKDLQLGLPLNAARDDNTPKKRGLHVRGRFDGVNDVIETVIFSWEEPHYVHLNILDTYTLHFYLGEWLRSH